MTEVAGHNGSVFPVGIEAHGTQKLLPVPELAPVARVAVKVIRSPELFDQLSRDRRATYASFGLELHDDALDAQRRLGTTLGLLVDDRLVGGFSAWRLSEALCSVGYLLRDVPVENHPPDKVVELGSMFVLPEYSGQGYVRALLEAGRVLLAGMKPELLVGFAVRAVVDRYVQQYGFRSVGPFVPHPLSGVEIMPLVATWDEAVGANCA